MRAVSCRKLIMYHCSVQTITRSKGQSICAAAAYRAGDKIEDARYGLTHDYSRKSGVVHSEIIGWTGDRESLWNAAEKSERRKDAVVGREIRLALPDAGMTDEDRIYMVGQFASDLSEKFSVAVDLAIHRPDRHGDQRNHHAHILITSRPVIDDEFSSKKDRRWNGKEGSQTIREIRKRWADHWNFLAEEIGYDIGTIDHRSYKDQGVDKVPTKHLGPARSRLKKRGLHTPEPTPNAPLDQQIEDEIEEVETEILSIGISSTRRPGISLDNL